MPHVHEGHDSHRLSTVHLQHVHLRTQKHIHTQVFTCTHVCTPPHPQISIVLQPLPPTPYFTTTSQTYTLHSLRKLCSHTREVHKHATQQYQGHCCTLCSPKQVKSPHKRQHLPVVMWTTSEGCHTGAGREESREGPKWSPGMKLKTTTRE